LAIGMKRIVMAPIRFPRHHILEKALHVLQQGILPLVQEYRGGGVQRLQMDDAVAHAALADDLIDAVRDVDELHPVIGDPVQHPVEHLESPRIWRHGSGRSSGVIRRYLDFGDLGIRTHRRSLAKRYWIHLRLRSEEHTSE